MTRGGFAESRNERALSEVIGFVLILGIITAAFSLYLVYGVPAQGRESEILHMNDIKDQFVTYKLSLDSLFNNNKVGTSVSNSFTLGTSGGFTQGSNSIIPILSPVSSSGVIAINERGAENLTITSESLVINNTFKNTILVPNNQNTTINNVPQQLYLNISEIKPSDLSDSSIFGTQLQGTDSRGNTWIALVNLTPRTTHYNETASVTCTQGNNDGGTCTISYNTGERYTGSDLTVTISKAGTTTLQDFVLYQNVTAGTNYSIDLMDSVYGLGDIIRSSTYPMTLSLSKTQSPSANIIHTDALAVFGYSELRYSSTIPMGSLEYRAKNNYWIPQTYYYQMGGVFLAQSDGNITWKLPPEISFSNDPSHNLVTVNINALTLDNSSSGMVGGNSPVQVKTTLDSITPLPFATVAEGTGNTKWIRIAVSTSDDKAREMWTNYFTYTAKAAGIYPYSNVSSTATESYIVINGPDADPNGAYDINVIASNATYVPSVHGVGGILQ